MLFQIYTLQRMNISSTTKTIQFDDVRIHEYPQSGISYVAKVRSMTSKKTTFNVQK